MEELIDKQRAKAAKKAARRLEDVDEDDEEPQ